MLNSKLAIELQSKKPLAILQFAKERFLTNMQTLASDAELSKRMNKYAFQRNISEVEFKQKRADGEQELEDIIEQALSNMSMPYITNNGTAVFPIEGVIGKNLSIMEKMIGCTDLNDLSACLKEWEANPNVQRIALKINSGGGTTTGLEEAAKQIFNLKKPTASFTDEDMGSAAYWLGSQCDRVIATPSATVGSIGIYVSFVDESAKFKDEGKKVIVIKSGDYKGAGIEGVPLTQMQGDWIQSEVLELHDIFKSTVTRSRSLVKEDDMQGQTFSGKRAAERGLVTGLADSWLDFLKAFEGSGDDINSAAGVRSTANTAQPTVQNRQSPTRKVR